MITLEGKERKLITLLIISPIVLILAIFTVTFFQKTGTSQLLQKPEPPREGSPAPNFTFPNLEGQPVSLSDFRGKVVFINIWATWCPTCVDEMASMQQLYNRFKGRDFEILSVSIDALGEQVVVPFMKKHQLTFPVLLDPTGKIKKLYATTGVPESFIVDKNGILVLKVIGPQNWAAHEVIAYFENLLKQGSS
jgi:peroxiredoxin